MQVGLSIKHPSGFAVRKLIESQIVQFKIVQDLAKKESQSCIQFHQGDCTLIGLFGTTADTLETIPCQMYKEL